MIVYNNKTAYVSMSYATLIAPTPTPAVMPSPTATVSPTQTPTSAGSPTPTITPTPTATPTPTTQQVVKIVNITSYLNIRSGASLLSSIIGKAYNGETYQYLGKSGSFWIINFKGQTGYAYDTYGTLTTAQGIPTPTATGMPTTTATPTATATPTSQPSSAPSQQSLIKVVNVTSNLNVRASASTTSKILGVAYSGETYLNLGKSGSFWKINYKGQTGYIYSTYGAQITSPVVRVKVTNYTTVRSQASATSSVLGNAYNFETYVYLGKSGDYLKITYKGKTGYINATYGVLL